MKGRLTLSAVVICLLMPAAGVPAQTAAADQISAPVLTTAKAVLNLGTVAAGRSPRPVVLSGTVTFRDPQRHWFFLQDSSGAVLIIPRAEPVPAVQQGAVVTVAGVSVSTQFDAGVSAMAVTVTGISEMPAAPKVLTTDAEQSKFFGQWVEMEGTIVEIGERDEALCLAIADGQRTLWASVHGFGKDALPADLLDARVRVRGVNWETYVGHLQVQSMHQVEVLEPGRADLFDAPLTTAARLKASAAPSATRMRCRGIARHVLPGGSIFLVDGETAFFAQLYSALGRRGDPKSRFITLPAHGAVSPGDELEIVGSPGAVGQVLELQYCHYQVLRRGLPVPGDAVATLADLGKGRHQGELVTVRGELRQVRETRRGAYYYSELVLEEDGVILRCHITATQPSGFEKLRQGHVTECTGFFTLAEFPDGPLRRLYLRTPADARTIGPVSPPIVGTLWRVLGGVAALAVVAGAWITVLRRQVRRRTAALAEANTKLVASEAELTESLLQAQELSELKSQFVSTVSHEFRTPLGVILSSTDILSRYYERLPPEKRAHHLQTIARNTQSLAGLMEEVLVLSRVESGKMNFSPEPLDLDELCRRLADETMSATGGQCPIHFSGSVNGSTATADEGLVRHIVSNLLSNAVKYSPPGAAVDFQLSHTARDAVITVKDRGIGIPPEDLPHVFDSFQRGRNVGQRQGTGLGLVIVKRCVEIHGGDISLRSTAGEGTTAVVTLPVFGSLA